jgi:hypothetical protein
MAPPFGIAWSNVSPRHASRKNSVICDVALLYGDASFNAELKSAPRVGAPSLRTQPSVNKLPTLTAAGRF